MAQKIAIRSRSKNPQVVAWTLLETPSFPESLKVSMAARSFDKSKDSIEGIFLRRYAERVRNKSSSKSHVLRMTVQPWVQHWLDRLKLLSAIDENWDGYGANAPSKQSVASASSCLHRLSEVNYQPTKVLASASGGVVFIFASEERYAALEFFNSGQVALELRQQSKPPLVRVLASALELPDTLDQVKRFVDGS